MAVSRLIRLALVAATCLPALVAPARFWHAHNAASGSGCADHFEHHSSEESNRTPSVSDGGLCGVCLASTTVAVVALPNELPVIAGCSELTATTGALPAAAEASFVRSSRGPPSHA